MKILLEHIDGSGKTRQETVSLGYLAFCKHAALAGAGKRKPAFYSSRYNGIVSEFRQYWESRATSFSLPIPFRNDPSEKAYVSYKVGRALADYFAKKIYSARFTHNYEDAMKLSGYSITGNRPDFYCDTLKKQFAIEAKGTDKKSISDRKMREHKTQSKCGPLSVQFSVASVAYNLYASPSVKFHDPIGEDVEYNKESNQELRSQYFNSILDSVAEMNLPENQIVKGDYISYVLPTDNQQALSLLVHRAIVERDWGGDDWFPENQDTEEDSIYIDLDGIGLLTN